jgi:salicylate hydroxylase
MQYPIKGRQLYNMVLAHPDTQFDSEESWTAKGSKDQLLKDFEGWDPELEKLLHFCPPGEVMRWKLCDHDILPTWVQGKFALMGDAWYRSFVLYLMAVTPCCRMLLKGLLRL